MTSARMVIMADTENMVNTVSMADMVSMINTVPTVHMKKPKQHRQLISNSYTGNQAD